MDNIDDALVEVPDELLPKELKALLLGIDKVFDENKASLINVLNALSIMGSMAIIAMIKANTIQVKDVPEIVRKMTEATLRSVANNLTPTQRESAKKAIDEEEKKEKEEAAEKRTLH